MVKTDTPVAITSVGIITPAIHEIFDMASYCRETRDSLNKRIENIPAPHDMSSRELRRMATLTRLALYATDKAFKNFNLSKDDCGLYIGLTHGSTSLLKEFHDYLFDFGPEMVSPNAFSNGVTNASLGAISKHLSLTQGGGTLVAYENCGLLALNQGAFSIAHGIYNTCCAGATEEYSTLVEEAYKKIHWYNDNNERPEYLPFPQDTSSTVKKTFPLSEACVFFILTTHENALNMSDDNYCFYQPVDDMQTFNEEVDLIISGAGAGAQDDYELEALSLVLSRQKLPTGILFSKPFFGETFAVSPLISSAMAWDILVNKEIYPSYPLHKDLKDKASEITDFKALKTILVIAASRDQEVSAGFFIKI